MSLLKERAIDLRQELLVERTKRRQQAAKAEMERRGVKPRVRIGSLYTPPHIARVFVRVKVA